MWVKTKRKSGVTICVSIVPGQTCLKVKALKLNFVMVKLQFSPFFILVLQSVNWEHFCTKRPK